MARYDKYDPIDGGFRAATASAIVAADKNTLLAVGLDSAGRVVVGAGQSGVVGVVVAHDAKKAGDIVDVMTDGEILELATATYVAGTVFYAATNGAISTTNTGTRIGHTVEAGRLVVRVAR